jgi:hypothetical protein
MCFVKRRTIEEWCFTEAIDFSCEILRVHLIENPSPEVPRSLCWRTLHEVEATHADG